MHEILYKFYFSQAGSLRSEPWRSKVDNLLIVIAMDSFKEGSASEEVSVFQQSELVATATDLQLASLRALLASFLSFARVRPPHLSQGLDLFRRGTSIYQLLFLLILISSVVLWQWQKNKILDFICLKKRF